MKTVQCVHAIQIRDCAKLRIRLHCVNCLLCVRDLHTVPIPPHPDTLVKNPNHCHKSIISNLRYKYRRIRQIQYETQHQWSKSSSWSDKAVCSARYDNPIDRLRILHYRGITAYRCPHYHATPLCVQTHQCKRHFRSVITVNTSL